MFKRLLRHFFAPSVRKMYPAESLAQIGDAIAEGEKRHGGEVVFTVRPRLPLIQALRGARLHALAEDAFARQRVWDTEYNNGVLIYLLLAERRIEIVADRGLDGKVGADQWQEVCHAMQQRLAAGEALEAAIEGVEAVSALLARHFPLQPGEDEESANELPDELRIDAGC